MDDTILDRIILTSKRLTQWAARFPHKRFLYTHLQQIDPEYYIGIKGIRGVGKTVLLLQLARETPRSVYFSADTILLKPYRLYHILNSLAERGFTTIFIDEIHRKPDWDEDIKSVYDEHRVRIIFSGSSALDITRTSADLSRRVILKELLPTSFREYLLIRKNQSYPSLTLQDILQKKHELIHHYAAAYEHFTEYLAYGGVLYPKQGFYDAVEAMLRKIITTDLAALRSITVKYENDAYALLHHIAQSLPDEVNYTSIATTLGISKTLAIRLVTDLARAGILIPIQPCAKQGVNIKKEPKIYLTIPLRKYFEHMGLRIHTGTLREEFFINNIRTACYVKGKRGEKTPAFRVNNLTIEIGGEGKTAYQNPDLIVTDSLKAEGKYAPLILFGFTY